MEDKLLNIQEVAQYLGVSIITVRRLAKRGDLQGFKVGKNWRFKQSTLLAYIARKEKGE
jgi:excisionase family DNA binding protein